VTSRTASTGAGPQVDDRTAHRAQPSKLGLTDDHHQ